MTLSQATLKSDLIGIFASGLCLVHCLVTPFLFLAYANADTHTNGQPSWWGILDIVFLVFSFFSVYWSVRNTTKKWIKPAFIFSWVILTFIVFNEKLELWHLPEAAIYPPTLGLIFLHFYNRRYCHCDDEGCCADNHK